jgi:hypothetical protein
MNDEHHDYRGYAGQIASGVFKRGDDVVVLPSGRQTKIAGIDHFDGPMEAAFPPLSVTLRLEDHVDVSRGDMICRLHNQPTPTRDLDAMICWMADEPLQPGRRYSLKHTTRTCRAVVDDLRYQVDVNTLHRHEESGQLGLNEIGRAHLRTSDRLLVDEYRHNRTTGSFILIDEASNFTVGRRADPQHRTLSRRSVHGWVGSPPPPRIRRGGAPCVRGRNSIGPAAAVSRRRSGRSSRSALSPIARTAFLLPQGRERAGSARAARPAGRQAAARSAAVERRWGQVWDQ